MNQSAIAMLQKTIEFMNKQTCLELMPEMIPPLLTVSFSFSLPFDWTLTDTMNER